MIEYLHCRLGGGRELVSYEDLAARLTELHHQLSPNATAHTAGELEDIFHSHGSWLLMLQSVMDQREVQHVTGFAFVVRRPFTRTALLDPIVVERRAGWVRGRGDLLLKATLAKVGAAWPDVRYVDLTASNPKNVTFYAQHGFGVRKTTAMRHQFSVHG